MKSTLSVIQILCLATIILTAVACDSANKSSTEGELEGSRSNKLLSDYAKKPIDKARAIAEKSDEHNKKLQETLDDN